MIVRATITDAARANVLVKASGLNSFPSAPIIVNTGRKLTIVVETAVSTALPTSVEARMDHIPGGSRPDLPRPNASRCFHRG